MLGALTLFLVGSADIARSGRSRVAASNAIIVIWGATCLVVTVGLGVPLWCSAMCLVIAGLWLVTTTSRQWKRHWAGFFPVAGLGVVILAFLALDRSAHSPSGFLVDWHATAPSQVLRAVPLPTLVLAISIALFLTASSNIIVRASLHPGKAPSTPTPRPTASVAAVVPKSTGRRWAWKSKRERMVDQDQTNTDLTAVDLRGGRLIGPVERLLIAALTLSGSFVVVAALVAAKGIVRFPEISRDNAGGSKAEYFLVGSLVSWAIAITLAGLVWISAHGS